ncbi:MAG: hypothetical protein JJU19_00775 [Pararhodobacter sp.]|nr:hypothetical protein [Pararhodobacter sp.]
MLHTLVGKIVETSEQVLTTTSGSITTGSVAGAGGVVYGNSGGGSVTTRHDNRITWKIFSTDEKVLTIDHFTNVSGEIGDIVAIFEDEESLVGVFNFTSDICYAREIGRIETIKRVGKAFALSFFAVFFLMMVMPDMIGGVLGSVFGHSAIVGPLATLAILILLWPAKVWIGLYAKRQRIRQMHDEANQIGQRLADEIQASMEKKKQRMRAI